MRAECENRTVEEVKKRHRPTNEAATGPATQRRREAMKLKERGFLVLKSGTHWKKKT